MNQQNKREKDEAEDRNNLMECAADKRKVISFLVLTMQLLLTSLLTRFLNKFILIFNLLTPHFIWQLQMKTRVKIRKMLFFLLKHQEQQSRKFQNYF